MSSAAVPAFARLIIKQSCNEGGLSGEARFGCVSAGWLKVRLCNLSSTTVHQCSSCQCPIAGSQHVLSFECIQLAGGIVDEPRMLMRAQLALRACAGSGGKHHMAM